MTKLTNYLATVTDVNSVFPPKGGVIANSERGVIKDQTGLLHQVGDVSDIKRSMERILFNKRLLSKFSKAAKARVSKEFDSKIITSLWVNFYAQHLHL